MADKHDSERPKKKFIKAATENAHGQFRAKAEAAGKSTREFAEEHKHDGGKEGKEANLALTLMSFHHKDAPQKKKRSADETRKKLYGQV